MYRSILLLCGFAVLSYAQITGFGPCPNIPPVANFNGTKFAGKWYLYARYPTPEDVDGKCMIANFVPVGNSTFTVTKSILAVSTSKETILTGQAYFSAALDAYGSLTFKFNGATSVVNVVETNYSTYSVLYACNNFFLYHKKYVWIYIRPKFSFLLNLSGARIILDKYGLNRDPKVLLTCDQINCPWLR